MAPNARDIYVRDSSSTTAPVPPRASACIILLSPTNEVLLLHRVQTSSSFPSAHVFPGGNLSSFHEPPLPDSPSSPAYHADSHAYRLAALRETFEESGILLATTRASNTSLVQPDPAAAAAARKAIHANTLHFSTWVEQHLHARLCTNELLPFTRWITPAWSKGGKRFSTQMYLFSMPLAAADTLHGDVDVQTVAEPTSDGGIEHTAATFAPAEEWLARQARGEIVLFPPQCFLLTLVARVFAGVGGSGREDYAAQREALVRFVQSVETGEGATAGIPWTDKVMSPEVLFRRESDGRFVLGVDMPGFELEGSGRGGDYERVVLVNFGKAVPRDVEVRARGEVMREREAEVKGRISNL